MSFQLSPTTVTMYKSCPFRYKCYCDPEIKRAYKNETPPLTQGQLIHGVLNSYFKDLPKVQRNMENLKSLYRKKFLANYDKHKKIFKDQQTINEYVLQSQKEFTNFLKSDFSKTEPFEATEKLFDTMLDDIRIIAKIDRIDQVEGGLHVIDYKTGRLWEEEPDSLQLNFYTLVIEKIYQKKVVRKTYLYLLEGKAIDIPVKESDEVETTKIILNTAKAIKNEKEFKPVENSQCKFCDYKPICPLKRKE